MMAEFKKYFPCKQEGVEAYQWHEEMGEGDGVVWDIGIFTGSKIYLLRGWGAIEDGDWVIRKAGRLSLLTDEEFRKRYEVVE